MYFPVCTHCTLKKTSFVNNLTLDRNCCKYVINKRTLCDRQIHLHTDIPTQLCGNENEGGKNLNLCTKRSKAQRHTIYLKWNCVCKEIVRQMRTQFILIKETIWTHSFISGLSMFRLLFSSQPPFVYFPFLVHLCFLLERKLFDNMLMSFGSALASTRLKRKEES